MTYDSMRVTWRRDSRNLNRTMVVRLQKKERTVEVVSKYIKQKMVMNLI